jgi:sec-independent protein translocase protein TatA
MPNVGPMELVLVLAVALIVLGPKKLPEVGRSLGKGMREFKDSISGKDEDDDPVHHRVAEELPPAAQDHPVAQAERERDTVS